MSRHRRAVFGSLGLIVAVGATRLPAQEGPLPLTPLPPSGDIVAPYFDGWYHNPDGTYTFSKSGDIVAPYFDGWYHNPDGTYTFSFGYFNRNTGQVIDIPIGPDNSIEPAEFDGLQPTHFRPVSYGGFSGRRERGTFAVTVPGDFRGDVVWTLRINGQTLRVPGRSGIGAYELSHSPQAAGTQPPFVKVEPDARPVFGRGAGATTALTAKVGQPVTLRVWGEDRGEREARFQVNATWVKHQGVGEVTFAPATVRSSAPPGGEMSTQAMFSAPGEYVIRVRVDNFTASDSSFADQCCWSNGYYRVTVTE